MSAAGYAVRRLRGIFGGWATIEEPPTGVRVERDVQVTVRDGTILRLNVFRPDGDGPYPVLLSAHPYGKDALPTKGLWGYRPSVQYRAMRQPRRSRISAWTGWEAPDPSHWVPRGYVVLNCDLRGFSRSDGEGSVFSRAQGRDLHDVVEWAAQQPWSNGKVGMLGVSYLAITQWFTAAERPPHLAAICPWEGFTDLYRDLCYPGGVRETGFVNFWSRMLSAQTRNRDALEREQGARPLWDDWWTERSVDLERIDVPALICGSFSDHNLHTRGSFEGFRRIASKDKWLYTHRDGKWNAFYSADALAWQERFFGCFLKGERDAMRDVPAVRLEVRDVGDAVHEVRAEHEWPLARTDFVPRYLHADGALRESPAAPGEARFETPRGGLQFTWTLTEDTEITGPMKLRLHVEARGADDLVLFVGVRKLRHGREVMFEGAYGFGRDLVTRGWCKASHRRLDAARSTPERPVLSHDRIEKLAPGEIVPLEIELLPSATLFRRSDELRLDVQGHYFFSRNPLTGQFPARYEVGPRATAVLHFGGAHDAHLLVPRIPPR